MGQSKKVYFDSSSSDKLTKRMDKLEARLKALEDLSMESGKESKSEKGIEEASQDIREILPDSNQVECQDESMDKSRLEETVLKTNEQSEEKVEGPSEKEPNDEVVDNAVDKSENNPKNGTEVKISEDFVVVNNGVTIEIEKTTVNQTPAYTNYAEAVTKKGSMKKLFRFMKKKQLTPAQLEKITFGIKAGIDDQLLAVMVDPKTSPERMEGLLGVAIAWKERNGAK